MGEIKNPDMLPFVPTPQGYSPYYYGTTIPETAYAQVANLFSLVNNTVLVGLQNLNVATEKTGLNTAIMAMPMTAPIVKAPRMLVELEEIAQTEQVLTKVSTVEKANIATRDVLTVARSDAFISAAIKQGYGAQLASLEAKISTLGSLGKIRYSWSFGARLTPSELTIGRMRLLFSKDTKIRHELGHMLQDISSGGKLLESEAQLSLSEVKNLEQQAYRMQGSSVISAELQATLNALANKYPRTTYGVATGATGAIIIYEIVGDK